MPSSPGSLYPCKLTNNTPHNMFSLGLLKPDCEERGLTNLIFEMIKAVGLKIVVIKTLLLTKQDVETFYVGCKNEIFFSDMSLFLRSAPVTTYIVNGNDAIERLNKLVGLTDPANAAPGTIRHMGTDIRHNLAHSSVNRSDFLREAGVIFNQKELIKIGII